MMQNITLTFTSGVQITYETLPSKNIHWHDTLQLIYQLSGKSKVYLSDNQYYMQESDLIVINPYQLHNVELLGASTALSIQFSRELLSRLNGVQFDCISFLAPRKLNSVFDHMRSKIASLFQVYYDDRSDDDLVLLSRAYEVLHILNVHFKCTDSITIEVDEPRISKLLKYLHIHYADEISLDDLSKHAFLSSNYLSQFFRKKLNTTFTNYVYEIRLNHAFYELCNTDKHITDIALDNGFGRVDNFINRFRTKYKVTPGKYRRTLSITNIDNTAPLPQLPPSSRFFALLRYSNHKAEPATKIGLPKKRIHIPISAMTTGKQISHDWRSIVNIGYADDCLIMEVQQQLADMQNAIGFDYVRFHGIFSDSMRFYYEDAEGNPTFRYALIDLLLDRLLSLGFNLFIEFSFLPELLSPDSTYVYQNRSYIGFPTSMGKWKLMVKSFLQHCIDRYGLLTVRKWKFSLFSISFALYGFLSVSEYYQLYKETFQITKQIDKAFLFAGPGIEGSLLLKEEDNTCRIFFQNCIKDKCVPDLLLMHSFPHSYEEVVTDFNQMVHHNDHTASFQLNSDERFMSTIIRAMKNLLQTLSLSHLPLMIDEWNATYWQRDLSSDTCYKAVYVIKNLLETMDMTCGKAYWTLSDLINDWKFEEKLFHGGHGLYTRNGIRKSVMHAFCFLSKLGNEVIASDNGFYITRSAQGIQIILYNYCHYNTMYRLLAEFNDPKDRYSAFQMKEPLTFYLDISDMPGKRYTCEYYSISQYSGSAFDEWIRLGAPDEITPENLAYLKHRSEPVRRIEQRNNLKNIKITLEPLEVMQILIAAHEE